CLRSSRSGSSVPTRTCGVLPPTTPRTASWRRSPLPLSGRRSPRCDPFTGDLLSWPRTTVSGVGSGQEVPTHAHKQGQHDHEQDCTHKTGTATQGHASTDLGPDDRAHGQAQTQDPVHVTTQGEDGDGADIGANIDDLGRGRSRDEIHADHGGEGDDEKHPGAWADETVVETHTQPGQGDGGQNSISGAQGG